MKQEKTGFIYIWFDKKRKMYYIGCHWGTLDDGYICSSDRMRKAYRRRPNDFKRRILKHNIERECLLEEEYKLLFLIKDEELGKKYYNLSRRHFGHWSNNESQKMSVGKKISAIQKGRKLTEEWKSNISASRKGKPCTHEWKDESREKMRQHNLGKKHSQETIEKRSESIRNKKHKRKIGICFVCGKSSSINTLARNHNDNCGIKRTVSDETKEKMRQAKLGKPSNRRKKV
jgi:hypothetical protein